MKAEKLAAWTPGKRVDALLDLLEQHLEAGIVVLVAGDGGVDVQAQHVLLVEAGVDMVQVDERAQEEAGAHHQHQRKRHLGDDQYLRQRRPAGGRGSAAAALEALDQLQARGPQSRQRSEQQRGAYGHREGEGEQAQVERDVERNDVRSLAKSCAAEGGWRPRRIRCPALRRPAPAAGSR